MDVNINESQKKTDKSNSKEKKTKIFDSKTKYKLKMENKKPTFDFIDYKKDLKSEKFEFYYKVDKFIKNRHNFSNISTMIKNSVFLLLN